jgi:hypothetical protein
MGRGVDVQVERVDARPGGGDLGSRDVADIVDDLPLQIVQLDRVGIDDSEVPDAGSSQIHAVSRASARV